MSLQHEELWFTMNFVGKLWRWLKRVMEYIRAYAAHEEPSDE
jgi:hypothetical protein